MIPSHDAPPGVARDLQDLSRRIDDLERLIRNPQGPDLAADVEELQKQLAKLSKRPTYLDPNDVMRASGAAHAMGHAPDPGAAAGTTKFLREDATYVEALQIAGGVVTGDLTVQGLLLGKRYAATFTSAAGVGTGAGYYVWDTSRDASGTYHDTSAFTRQNSNQEVKVTRAGFLVLLCKVGISDLVSSQTDTNLRAGVGGAIYQTSQVVTQASGYGHGHLFYIGPIAANALFAVNNVAGNRYGYINQCQMSLVLLA